MMQRREILARIAKGEVKVCRYVKDGDSYRMLFEDTRPRDMIRAIETDAKMEAACNRARNFTDPVLSQFNIYIDGRPCDDPAAPINTDLPPGIVMLPRTRKKLTAEQKQETPLLSLGGENGEMPTGMSHSGEVDSRGTQNTSPHPGDLGVQLAQEKNPTENGNPSATLGIQNTSPHPGDLGVLLAQENTPISPQSPLYPSYLHILEKRKLSEEDILHASWYSQHKRAEAAVPPPHILTDEEIAGMDRALAEERSRTLGQPQYSTFGKMYFPEKDTRCSL